jgi:hypothetical protein
LAGFPAAYERMIAQMKNGEYTVSIWFILMEIQSDPF